MIYLCRIFLVIILVDLCPLFAEIQDISVEFRSAAFFHSSKLFREIYGNVSGCYELEASTRLNNCMDGWVNVDWFSKHGNSKECEKNSSCEKCTSRVSIANISLGIKYPYYCWEQATAYIGIGPSISRIWLKNEFQHRHEREAKLAIGGILKTGINYYIKNCLFIDLFVDYLYQPVHFKKSVDIGGFKAGAGLGFNF